MQKRSSSSLPTIYSTQAAKSILKATPPNKEDKSVPSFLYQITKKKFNGFNHEGMFKQTPNMFSTRKIIFRDITKLDYKGTLSFPW